MAKMVRIRFNTHYNKFNAGETAAVTEAEVPKILEKEWGVCADENDGKRFALKGKSDAVEAAEATKQAVERPTEADEQKAPETSRRSRRKKQTFLDD